MIRRYTNFVDWTVLGVFLLLLAVTGFFPPAHQAGAIFLLIAVACLFTASIMLARFLGKATFAQNLSSAFAVYATLGLNFAIINNDALAMIGAPGVVFIILFYAPNRFGAGLVGVTLAVILWILATKPGVDFALAGRSLFTFLASLVVVALYGLQNRRLALSEAKATTELKNFKQLLNFSNAAWFRVRSETGDFRNSVVEVNDHYRTCFGLPANRYPVINREVLRDRLPQDTRTIFKESCRRLLKKVEPVEFQHKIQNAEGEVKYCNTFMAPIHAEDSNAVIGYEGYIIDVTEQVRSSERMKRAKEVGGAGLFEHNLSTNLVEVSDSFRSILELPETEFPGLIPFDAVMTRIDPSYLVHVRAGITAAIQSRETQRQIIPARLPSGKQIKLRATLAAELMGDKPVQIVGALSDVTELLEEQKRASDRATELEASLRELRFKRFAMDQHLIYAETDTQGNILDVNEKFCEISGYNRLELVGRNHRILSSGQHSPLFWKAMYAKIAKGEVWHGVICNRAKEGREYWVQTTIVPFKDAAGKVVRYQALGTEITEAIESAKALELAVDAGEVGLFNHDLITDHVLYNARARELWDLPGEEGEWIPVSSMAQRIAPDYQAKAFEEMQAAIAKDGPSRVIWPIVTTDGQRITCQIQVLPEYRDGKPVRVRGAIIDVSALYETQAQLAGSLDTLKEMQQRRNQLFGMVAHELRTPVAAIQMLCNESDEAEWSSNRAIIAQGAKDLAHTIDDMRLVINPNEQRPVRAEWFNFQQLNAAVAASVAPVVADNSISYHQFNAVPNHLAQTSLYADSYRIRAAVTNLIRNACLHSGGSDVWTVTQVYKDQQGARFIEWRVGDNGVGIAEDEIKRLFEPGERGQSTATGNGLGLHIAKTWMEEIGGDLIYQRREQGGSEFRVRLPLTQLIPQASEAAETTEDLLDSTLKQMRVLLVEDEPMLRMLGQKMLGKLGCRVDVASNGREGYEASSKGYDLILSDYFMPEMSGVEMIRKLREEGYVGSIVGVTAATIADQIDEIAAAGADMVLAKPLNSEMFRSTIQQLMESGRLTRSGGNDEA